MKRLLLAIILLVGLGSAAEAQIYRVGTPLSLAWDYSAADILAGTVTRFETSIDGDGSVYVNTGLPVPSAAYLWPIPAQAIGTHTARVRACSALECGPAATLTFEVRSVLPPTPSNPRIVPGVAPITGPQAVELAHAYSTIAIGRKLSNAELQALSLKVSVPSGFLSVGAVLAVMDAEYLRIFPATQ